MIMRDHLRFGAVANIKIIIRVVAILTMTILSIMIMVMALATMMVLAFSGGMEKGALTMVVVWAHGGAGVVWGREYFGI